MTIHLSPERSQACLLKHRPPLQELVELLAPDVDLELELTERQRLAIVHVRFHQCGQRLELPALDVDLEDVDVIMAVHRHQALERIHLVLVTGAVGVRTCKSERLEVRTVEERRLVLDLGAKRLNREVVPPDLAIVRAVEELSLERRLVVDTDGVDDAVRLVRHAREPTDPFAAIPERTDPLHLVRAVECSREEVPDGVWRPGVPVWREPAGLVEWVCEYAILKERISWAKDPGASPGSKGQEILSSLNSFQRFLRR